MALLQAYAKRDESRCTADGETSVATPVNWQHGEDVIIVPALSDEEAKKRFPEGWKALKPCLRITPHPKSAV